jgi:hypothetical protein
VAKASVRKACVDAFVTMLKSDEPVLLSQVDKLSRGLLALNEPTLAQDTIKRRKTYVPHALMRFYSEFASRRQSSVVVVTVTHLSTACCCVVNSPDRASRRRLHI